MLWGSQIGDTGNSKLFLQPHGIDGEIALDAPRFGRSTGKATLMLWGSRISDTGGGELLLKSDLRIKLKAPTVQVDGNLVKPAGQFRIDHPLDPANRYLSHSFVESPEMLNVYGGTLTTGGDDEAVVTLPDYFEALNRDFRYQLTVIGQFAQAIVAREIENN